MMREGKNLIKFDCAINCRLLCDALKTYHTIQDSLLKSQSYCCLCNMVYRPASHYYLRIDYCDGTTEW